MFSLSFMSKDCLRGPNELSEEVESQQSEYEGEAEPRKTPRKEWHAPSNSKDFRVDMSEFQGKLDPDEFLEWVHTMKRTFEYKDVPKHKKVQLVALRF